jgi:hypothetical protein
MHGRIDRFAPGNNARAFSLDLWLALCARAQAMAAQTADAVLADTLG